MVPSAREQQQLIADSRQAGVLAAAAVAAPRCTPKKKMLQQRHRRTLRLTAVRALRELEFSLMSACARLERGCVRSRQMCALAKSLAVERACASVCAHGGVRRVERRRCRSWRGKERERERERVGNIEREGSPPRSTLARAAAAPPQPPLDGAARFRVARAPIRLPLPHTRVRDRKPLLLARGRAFLLGAATMRLVLPAAPPASQLRGGGGRLPRN
jgi:hypothetical protein